MARDSSIYVEGKLNFGVDHGAVLHKEFMMRPATIADVVSAIEKAGDTPSNLKLRIFKAAEQIVSLGTLDKSEITGELLLSLPEDDIEPLFAKQDEVEKKQKGSKSASSPTSS